jgi:hypothetical protein
MMFSEPGRYFTSQGKEVSEAQAERAGFDTTHWRLQRMKSERLASAKARVEAEFAEIAAQAEAEAASKPKAQPKPATPTAQPTASAARDYFTNLR